MQQGAWIALPISMITMFALYHSTFFYSLWILMPYYWRKPLATYMPSFGVYHGIAGYVLLRNLIEGMSETKPTMIISVLGLGLNIPINYLFIYGAGLFQQWVPLAVVSRLLSCFG